MASHHYAYVTSSGSLLYTSSTVPGKSLCTRRRLAMSRPLYPVGHCLNLAGLSHGLAGVCGSCGLSRRCSYGAAHCRRACLWRGPSHPLHVQGLVVACWSRPRRAKPNQDGHSLRVTCTVTAFSMDSGAYQFAARDRSPANCTSTSKPPHRLARIMVL